MNDMSSGPPSSPPDSVSLVPTSPPGTLRTPTRRTNVLGGRIQKARKKLPENRFASPPEKVVAHLNQRLDDDEQDLGLKRLAEMEKEKALYPDAHKWSAEEERLFEVLFMRGYSPLLPSYWGLDFSGIPIPDLLFQTTEDVSPVIYAHSTSQFHGMTMAPLLLATIFQMIADLPQQQKR
jgi:hypothetical protein